MSARALRVPVVLWSCFCSVVLAPLVVGQVGAPAETVPDGLSAADWAGIREAYEAGRHAVFAGEDGHQARNPGQRWRTHFDGRGFVTRPDAGDWTWGLELTRYGFAGAEREATTPVRVTAEGARVGYEWNADLEEWFVNDQRGLEHGYTVHRRPPRDDARDQGPLTFTLSVRGELSPVVADDGRDVRFLDETGDALLTYTGLRVFDADGRDIAASFTRVDDGLHLAIDERDARYPLTIDPVAQQAYLKAANTDPGDQFGSSVAVHLTRVVVGAPFESSNATGVDGDASNNSAALSGAAYVFVNTGGAWSQEAYLKASNTDANDLFGWTVAIFRGTVVVGAIGEASSATGVNGNQNDNSKSYAGAAYVFELGGSGWAQEAYVKASNTDASDNFGWSASVFFDILAVGAHQESSDAVGVNGNQGNNNASWSGAVYVFARSGTVWSQEAYLKAANAEVRDWFGYSLDSDSNTVVVGATHEDSGATGVNGNAGDNSAGDSGAAYVFVRSGTTWSQQAYLKASNTDPADDFGRSIALSGNTVLVGAPHEDSNAAGVNGDQGDDSVGSAGAAYVYFRSGTSWSQEAYLKASNPGANDWFGRSVAMAGDVAVVGAPYEDSNASGVDGDQGDNSFPDSGAAYAFVRSGATWNQLAYLKASACQYYDYFGLAVATDSNTAVVGAVGEDSNATGVNGDESDDSAVESGAAYAFQVDVPLAGCLWYCGTGANAGSSGYYVTAPAVLGGTFGTSVTNCTVGNTGALLAAYSTPLTLPTSVGELLINVADPHGELLGFPSALGNPAVFQLPVPSDPLLAGVVFYTQAVSFGGSYCLHCAYECSVGY